MHNIYRGMPAWNQAACFSSASSSKIVTVSLELGKVAEVFVAIVPLLLVIVATFFSASVTIEDPEVVVREEDDDDDGGDDEEDVDEEEMEEGKVEHKGVFSNEGGDDKIVEPLGWQISDDKGSDSILQLALLLLKLFRTLLPP